MVILDTLIHLRANAKIVNGKALKCANSVYHSTFSNRLLAG